MLTELILIATAGILNPMDMSGNELYPSGVKECDKYPKYSPPQSKLALFVLPKPIIANDNRIIPAGHYLASLSVSRNELLLFENQKEIYSLTVSEITTMEKAYKLSTADFYSDDNDVSFIILKQGKYKVKVNVLIQKNCNTSSALIYFK